MVTPEVVGAAVLLGVGAPSSGAALYPQCQTECGASESLEPSVDEDDPWAGLLADDPALDQSEARRSIDALVGEALFYRSSSEYRRLLDFMCVFRWYSPFNALLVDIQRRGSTYVATADRWRREYGRCLTPDARPLAILQPFGPVMFVYDVSDTVAMENAGELPAEVTDPFSVEPTASTGTVDKIIQRTIENAMRDGVRVTDVRYGSQLAGRIATAPTGSGVQRRRARSRPEATWETVPVMYELTLSAAQSALTKYATLIHELAHLYCGHLGTPNKKGWPDRSELDHRTMEFEAESVSAIVVRRLDPEAALPPYLAQHLSAEPHVPDRFSLDRVTTVSQQIIDMGTRRLPSRQERPA